MDNPDYAEQIANAKKLLPGYVRYRKFHDEMEHFFRQRFGVIMIQHKGEWYWKMVDSEDRVVTDDRTFGGMLQWCLDNRGDYENMC